MAVIPGGKPWGAACQGFDQPGTEHTLDDDLHARPCRLEESRGVGSGSLHRVFVARAGDLQELPHDLGKLPLVVGFEGLEEGHDLGGVGHELLRE